MMCSSGDAPTTPQSSVVVVAAAAAPGEPSSRSNAKKAIIKVVPNRKRFHGAGISLNQAAQAPLIHPPPPASTTKRPRTTAIHLDSKADVESKLVMAVSGGSGSQSTTDKFLRKATRRAVAHQYDMTLANARLKAAWSTKFTVQVLAHGRMKVRFLAGVRAWREEEVDCLQPTELRTALNDSPDEDNTDILDHRSMRNAAAKAAMARLREATTAMNRQDLPPTISIQSTLSPHTSTTALPILFEAPATAINDKFEEAAASVTVLCDACGKARIVLAADAANNGLLDSIDEQSTTSGGCAKPDDEVLGVVQGDMEVAQSLDAVGMKSRKALANADADALFSTWRRTCPRHVTTLDALELIVQEARRYELDECMQQHVLQDAPHGVLAALEAAKLATPHDLARTPADLIVRELEMFHVTEAVVATWQALANDAMEMSPWMEDWRSV
ncbi:hypothetical protein DYB34_009144 [Aphanomyces astaci]|uniref:Uncharacterized protein n=2 Tax=Aphanomyces astaci TaxID=112090 RepID=A0A418CEG1_APHAT|nr:hypothetical protein DYB34_009144 [Aphanomyces astaci]